MTAPQANCCTVEWVRRILVLVFLALSAMFTQNVSAATEIVLVSSTPANGATVAQLPATIVLTFSTPITPSVVQLSLWPTSETQPSSPIVAYVAKTVQPATTIMMVLPSDTIFVQDAVYELRWNIRRSLNSGSGGKIVFTIGNPTTTATTTATTVPASTDASNYEGSAPITLDQRDVAATKLPVVAAHDDTHVPASNSFLAASRAVLRWLMFAGASLLTGAWFWKRQKVSDYHPAEFEQTVDRLHRTGVVMVSFAASGCAIAAFATASSVSLTSANNVAAVAASSAMFMFALVAVAAFWARFEPHLAIPVVVLAGLAVAGASHAAEAHWWAISVGFAATHWVALTIWLGPLACLLTVQYQQKSSPTSISPQMVSALRDYGRVALYAVAIAVVCGIRQTLTIVDTFVFSRWTTLLLVKLGVAVLAVLPVATFHHFTVKRAAHNNQFVPALRHLLLWEVCAAGLVAVLAEMLASTIV